MRKPLHLVYKRPVFTGDGHHYVRVKMVICRTVRRFVFLLRRPRGRFVYRTTEAEARVMAGHAHTCLNIAWSPTTHCVITHMSHPLSLSHHTSTHRSKTTQLTYIGLIQRTPAHEVDESSQLSERQRYARNVPPPTAARVLIAVR